MTSLLPSSQHDDLVKANKEIDEWMSIAAELKEKYPVLFDLLMAKIGEDENPEEEINRLNRAYEDGEPKAKTAYPRSQRLMP